VRRRETIWRIDNYPWERNVWNVQHEGVGGNCKGPDDGERPGADFLPAIAYSVSARSIICFSLRRNSALLCSPIPLEVNMALTTVKFLIGLLILSESTLVQAKCLRTVHQLKAHNVKARWQETTENDGKPLKIEIYNGANDLVYSARKAGVLWLTGSVSVCLSGSTTEVILKDTKTTKNVPMFARMGLPHRQSTQIVDNQMILGGGGWSGTFVGH